MKQGRQPAGRCLGWEEDLGMASGNEELELREGSAVPGEPRGSPAGHGHLPRWALQGWMQPPAGWLGCARL